jgi:RHS repeat-associated protein
MNHRFKRMAYDYDLISGNVKRVRYQPGRKDQWSHRYTYDADNRITEVETSADGVHWQRDARYFYYPHGPLERTELGAHVVQGTDYAYTLQGWLKGINGDRLDPATDMGHDGDPGISLNPNGSVGRDAYALSLGYYGDDDYKAINPDWISAPATRAFATLGTPGIGSTLPSLAKPLYNGNIAHTVNSLQPFGLWGANGQSQVLAQVYAYDQLNRLKKSRGIIGLDGSNNWEGITDAEPYRYQSLYEYDANGNITYCDRHDEDGLRYDALRYNYQLSGAAGRLLRNRLYLVKDSEEDIEVTDIGDFPNHEPTFQDPYNAAGNINTANSYSYDALGNLTKDATAGISAIDWTVAGKVKDVHRVGGSALPKLHFAYGASGQRILKQVGQPGIDEGAYREHYIRDAQGNIMATYRYTNATATSLKLNERPLYGSSRLGSLRKEVEVYNAPTSVNPGANPVQLVELNYELTDHLGNVGAVVTGRLLTNLFGVTPCQAELVSATGYEAFGGVQTGRHWNSGAAHNGFNGMRKENELNGAEGMAYDFGARLYDSRIGKWSSVDDLHGHNPQSSPYTFVNNTPVIAIDPDGNKIKYVVRGADRRHLKSVIRTLRASETANTMFNALRKSHHVFTVDIGDLSGDRAGEFKPHYGTPEVREVLFYQDYEDTDLNGEARMKTRLGGVVAPADMLTQGGGEIIFDKTWLHAPADYASSSVAEEFAHAFQYMTSTPTLESANASAPMFPASQAIEFEAKMITMRIIGEAKLNILPDEIYNGVRLPYSQLDQVYAEEGAEQYLSGTASFLSTVESWGKKSGPHYASLPLGKDWKPTASERLGMKPQSQSE